MFDSEVKIMEIIWDRGADGITAKEISTISERTIGWNKNTTYTVIKKLIEKGYVKREEPGFMCFPLVEKKEIQRTETQGLIKKFFGGSKKALMSSLLENESLTEDEINELRDLIRKR